MEQEPEYTLVEHLTELRKRLIIVSVTFIVTLIIGFSLAPKLLTLIKIAAYSRSCGMECIRLYGWAYDLFKLCLSFILTDYIANRIVPNMVICKTWIIYRKNPKEQLFLSLFLFCCF